MSTFVDLPRVDRDSPEFRAVWVDVRLMPGSPVVRLPFVSDVCAICNEEPFDAGRDPGYEKISLLVDNILGDWAPSRVHGNSNYGYEPQHLRHFR